MQRLVGALVHADGAGHVRRRGRDLRQDVPPGRQGSGQAAGHFRGRHARSFPDPSQPGQLVEALVHAEQRVAVGHRQHAPVGRVPLHLLADLVGKGLVAVHPVGVAPHRRAEVGRGRVPSPFGHPGLQQLPALGLGLRGHHHGAVGLDLGHEGGGRALDREDDAGKSHARGVGCGRGPGVAGGTDPHRLGPEPAGHGQGGDRQPVLEGARRVPGLVLEVELGEAEPASVALAVQQRRHALAKGRRVRGVHRQQFAVAPQVRGAMAQGFHRKIPGDGVEIVSGREVGGRRPPAPRAPLEAGLDAEGRAAAYAGQPGEMAHARGSRTWRFRGTEVRRR